MPDETYRFSIPGPAGPAGETFTAKPEMFRDIKDAPLWHGVSPVVPVGDFYWIAPQKPNETEEEWARRCGVIRNIGAP